MCLNYQMCICARSVYSIQIKVQADKPSKQNTIIYTIQFYCLLYLLLIYEEFQKFHFI